VLEAAALIEKHRSKGVLVATNPARPVAKTSRVEDFDTLSRSIGLGDL
jgi:hypothetical protein